MTIIEPSHKEIMQYLDCFYHSRWHKGQCQCLMPCQFKHCYEDAKKRLTRYIYTDEEIKQAQEKAAKQSQQAYESAAKSAEQAAES